MLGNSTDVTHMRDMFSVFRAVLYGVGITMATLWMAKHLLFGEWLQLGFTLNLVMLVVAGLSILAAHVQPALDVTLDGRRGRMRWQRRTLGRSRVVDCNFDDIEAISVELDPRSQNDDFPEPRYLLAMRIDGQDLPLPAEADMDLETVERQAARLRALVGLRRPTPQATPLAIDVDALIRGGRDEEAVAALRHLNGFTLAQAQADVRTRGLFHRAQVR
jgi:hypothetical protein